MSVPLDSQGTTQPLSEDEEGLVNVQIEIEPEGENLLKEVKPSVSLFSLVVVSFDVYEGGQKVSHVDELSLTLYPCNLGLWSCLLTLKEGEEFETAKERGQVFKGKVLSFIPSRFEPNETMTRAYEDLQARVTEAEKCFRDGDTNKAYELFQAAHGMLLRLAPGQKKSHPDLVCKCLDGIAVCHFSVEQFSLAIEFSKASLRVQQRPLAFYRLALALWKNKDYAEASKHFTELKSRFPVFFPEVVAKLGQKITASVMGNTVF
jgi:tetratricopeptide (TPR) repeat protein